MAFNPAAANVTSRSSGLSQSDQSLRIESSRQFGSSRFRQELPTNHGDSGDTMRPGSDRLYTTQLAGSRSQLDGSFQPDHFETKPFKYTYGDYWEPSLKTFPLATFEAQLYTQMLVKGENIDVTPYQGNEAYNATKSIMEEAFVKQNEKGNLIEENQPILKINIKA